MANADGTMADLDVRDGLLSTADAIKPILHMPPRLPQCELIAPLSFLLDHIDFLEELLGDVGWVGGEFIAVDLQLPLLTNKDRTTHRTMPGFQREVDLDTIGVAHRDFSIGSA